MLSRKLFISSIVLSVLLSFSLVVAVEASPALFGQTYVGTGFASVRSLVETADGGFALVGEIN